MQLKLDRLMQVIGGYYGIGTGARINIWYSGIPGIAFCDDVFRDQFNMPDGIFEATLTVSPRPTGDNCRKYIWRNFECELTPDEADDRINDWPVSVYGDVADLLERMFDGGDGAIYVNVTWEMEVKDAEPVS